MLVITRIELEKTLSVLPCADPLAWFSMQPKPLLQDIARLIRSESIAVASSRIKTIYTYQQYVIQAKVAPKPKRTKRTKRTKPPKPAPETIRKGTIVATIIRIGTKPITGLMIETEYGLIRIKCPQLDAKHLTLFVEDGTIVDQFLSTSNDGIKPLVGKRKNTHENATPHVYDLIIKYDPEQVLALAKKTGEKDSVLIAKAKLIAASNAKEVKNTTSMLQKGPIVATLVRVPRQKSSAVVRLSIDTEYGSIIAKPPQPDMNHLILFIKYGEIFDYGFSKSIDGAKTSIGIKRKRYANDNLVGHIYDLIINHNPISQMKTDTTIFLEGTRK